MTKLGLIFFLSVALAGHAAPAGDKPAEFEQRIGRQLPLDAVFVDARGTACQHHDALRPRIVRRRPCLHAVDKRDEARRESQEPQPAERQDAARDLL